MFWIKRIVIAPHERGMYIKDRSIVKILVPGIYRYFDPMGRLAIEIYDLTVVDFRHRYMDVFIKNYPKLVDEHFQVIDLGEYEVGLVYKNAKLNDVLPPVTRQLYWKGLYEIDVKVLNIEADYSVPDNIIGLIAHSRFNGLAINMGDHVTMGEIPDHQQGLLMVDNVMTKTLASGLYAFWKFNRNIKVEQVELRIQVMEVQGQEILTKDKVSLRVNLSAQYQVTDPVVARSKLVNFIDYIYREMQFALRQAVGGRTLDTLLGNKDELDRDIYNTVKEKMAEFGLEVRNVGVKDVILPGDMKDILNRVVEAEKLAQANVIKRREETSATRSLLNTAKMMDDNPTLMRLKELEILEKVTEKIDKLTVFGGLEGILNDTVRLNLKAD